MYQRKNRAILAFIVFLYSFLPVSAAQLKVFFYMDSSDDLSDMAIKNVTDMVRGKSNNTVEFLIQLHAYSKAALRYQVTDKGLVFIEEVTLSGDSKQDFINAAQWAFKAQDFTYSMLVFSNHGWGILDPQWNNDTHKWETKSDPLSDTCMIKRSQSVLYAEHKQHKGFMFNAQSRTYLNNQDLISGLSFIKTHLLKGKPLDVLAFDTCMGSMLEIGYQVAPFARYLIGSQSCSLRDGFDYHGIMAVLNQGLPPRAIAEGMVQAFNLYYGKNDTSGVYTHAVLDLSHVYSVNKALDLVISNLLNIPEHRLLITKACVETPRFCMWPIYTDLIAFCKIIETQLSVRPSSPEIIALQQALKDFYSAAQPLVVARCGGHTTQGQAYGFAIYLPFSVIDDSYYSTLFAQESQWIKLLAILCNQDKKA